MAATVSGAIAGKGCRNGVVCINIRKCIAIDCSYALFIHFHIGNGIAAVRRDGENLVRTLGPQQRWPRGLMEPPSPAEAVIVKVCAFSCQTTAKGENPERSTSNSIPLASNSAVITSGSQASMASVTSLTGNAIFPVQARKVDDLYIQVICVIHCHTVGIWQIDCGAIAGRNQALPL